MANLQIQLDPIEATTQAIVGILTPEVRDRILQQSISNLLKPSTDSWDKNKSPLEQAFDNAVSRVAQEIAHEYVKNDKAIMDQLAILIRKTADKVISQDVGKLAEKMSESFVSALQRER